MFRFDIILLIKALAKAKAFLPQCFGFVESVCVCVCVRKLMGMYVRGKSLLYLANAISCIRYAFALKNKQKSQQL
jgi:hypothetical protein